MLRIVLRMPEALPAIRGGTSRITAAVIGANVKPMPKPVSASEGSKVHGVASSVEAWMMAKIPTTMVSNTPQRTRLVPLLSLSRPENGAEKRIVIDIGDIARPALIAE